MAAERRDACEIAPGGYRIPPDPFRIPRAPEPLALHVTMRVADGRVIAPTAAARRIAARTFLELGDTFGLLVFRVVDNHAHAMLPCSRTDAGEFARRVEIALRARLQIGCTFDPARFRPVLDQWHLQSTVQYILDQERRHGLALDPAHDGSSLPELLRWRVLPSALADRVRMLVPRFVARMPLPRTELQAAVPAPELLAEAAAAAFALPNLDGIAPPRSLARRAAVGVAEGERIRRGVVAEVLGLTRRRVEQLVAAPPVDPRVLYAVRAQLRLRSALAGGRRPAEPAQRGPPP